MFSRLSRLTLSGGINGFYHPFISRSSNWEEYGDFEMGRVEEKEYEDHAPATFNDVVRDLADGCRTLEVVTMGTVFRDLSIKDGLSRKVVREIDGGAVKELRKIKAFGNIIGREDEL